MRELLWSERRLMLPSVTDENCYGVKGELDACLYII